MRLGDPADPKKHPELRKHIREFAERREKLKARAQESRAEPRLTDDEIDEDPDPLTLPSLDGVIADAEKRHAGKLFFALNSASETGLFKRADRAAKAFDFLAGTFRDAKRGTRKVPNLPLAAKEESGFEYVPHQSDTTVGMYERDYTAMHHGQTVYVTQHLRTGGNTRDPSRLLRIGFQYLEEEGVVLVGYIGPHQRNRST